MLHELKEAISQTVVKRKEDGYRIISIDEMSSQQWLFDFRALLLQPKWLNIYAELFWNEFKDRYPFQVCGMETAAIGLVAAIVMKGVERGTPVNGLYIRKSRKRKGLLTLIEGTPTNEPVILVDDLINSGKTFLKQIKILEKENLLVSNIFALVAFRERKAYSLLEDRRIGLHSFFGPKDFNLEFDSSQYNLNEPYIVFWKFEAQENNYNVVLQKSALCENDDKLFFGTETGIFFALDKNSGEVCWSFAIGKHPGKGILSSPVINNNIVFFGAYDGAVYALAAETGKIFWKYEEADWVGSSPAVAKKLHLIFIGLEFGLFKKRGGIAALNTHTGKEVWRNITPALTHCSPLYIEEENLVIIGSNDATIYAYNAKTGEEIWRQIVFGNAKASFVYNPERRLVLFGTIEGHFFALQTTDGTPVFSFECGSIFSTPVILNSTIFFSSLDKTIYAVDLDSGKEIWSFATYGRIFASPIIAKGSLWCGSNDGRLYELDYENGKIKSTFQATERIVNKILFDEKNDCIYVPTQANEVYCLKKLSTQNE